MFSIRLKFLAKSFLVTCLLINLYSCTYLKYTSVQAEYARIQNAKPGQVNAKHMIDRETYFIHGQTNDASGRYSNLPKAVVAFSDWYQPHERVDIMHFAVNGSHYGLNLPDGAFDILVFADIDRDGTFSQNEVVAKRSIELNDRLVPNRVIGQVDLDLGEPATVGWSLSITVPDSNVRSESLFYPAGTIRDLDEPIFDTSFSTLGMYDPASFLEQAPTMFYALDEDLSYKIPVVFVHGIGGSAREFETFVKELDRTRYKPWFFHYPSGGDLDQLAELFYQIFLSGKVYQSNGMPIIVIAHSMGGLIVREAINRYEGKSQENQLRLFASLATPFGGHAAAAAGEKHGLIVLPSWRDLNPDNAFIRELYRKPLPEFVEHQLIYAFQNPGTIKLGENSDGVVALSSQLHAPAQSQSSGQFGFDNTHTDILNNPSVFRHIDGLMESVRNFFPPSHLEVILQGGYDVHDAAIVDPLAAYTIANYGKYMMALAAGELTALDREQERFISVARGEKAPRSELEKSWMMFVESHPDFRNTP